eukprot:Ihof_evm7s123 gene=Ihof_evmTU7s123
MPRADAIQVGGRVGDVVEQEMDRVGSTLSTFNYVVTAQKPTAVNFVCTGRFLSQDKVSVIVSKFHRLEIHVVTSEGLSPVMEFPIYGVVEVMKLFRPP